MVVIVGLLPTLAIAVRRLHDLDYRGWWVLIAVIPYLGPAVMAVGFCLKGTPGANRFGPDPLEIGDVASHAT